MSSVSPHVDPLAQWRRNYVAGREPAARFYRLVPSELPRAAAERQSRRPAPFNDAELAEWRAWLEQNEAPAPTLAALERLRAPNHLVLATGQQPGLLGGPLLTLYKAIGAILCARRLEAETGCPVVPVFWVASDDHDFAEAARVVWSDGDDEPRELRIEETPGEAGWPLYARRAVPELSELRAQLSRPGETPGLPGSATREESWESQFVLTLLQALGPLGLVPVAPRLDFLRRRAMPLMRHEIMHPGESSRALAQRAKAMREGGAPEAMIHRDGDEANFFVLQDSVRCKVTWQGPDGVLSRPGSSAAVARLTREELLARLESSPGDFSPAAALRPVVQDAAFATVGYVSGPSELVYHGQLEPLYEATGTFRPVALARPSAVLLTPKLARACEKLGVEALDVVNGGRGWLADRVAEQSSANPALARLEADIASLAARAVEIRELAFESTRDTGVRKAADELAVGTDQRGARLLERLRHAVAQADTAAATAHRRVADGLLPLGEPQERAYGWAGFLWSRYGSEGIEILLSQLDATHFETRAITLPAPGSAG